MAPLSFPSRLEPVSVPIFAISWFVPRREATSSGRYPSIVAYCGGGGSARTGIQNAVFVDFYFEGNGLRQSLTIPTGDEIAVALKIYEHNVTKSLWLVICVNNFVRRYRLPSGEPAGEIDLGEEVSTVSISKLGDCMAVGCESGKVILFDLSKHERDDATFTESTEIFSSDRHKKAVCCIAFADAANRLMTSGKDGTAIIYEGDAIVSGFKCSVTDDNDPPPPAQRTTPQIIVKGCAFLDPEGRHAVTVASPRRGKSYIARWEQGPGQDLFSCTDKEVCYKNPISSFSLSADGTMMALGSSDGSVLLRDVYSWKTLKTFVEVHDFPVTCIAARPYPSALLLGEEDDVKMDARSASADGRLACLTRQRKGPKLSDQAGVGFFGFVNFLVYAAVLAYVLSPVVKEYHQKCGHMHDLALQRRCLLDDVLLAPASQAGVAVPPY